VTRRPIPISALITRENSLPARFQTGDLLSSVSTHTDSYRPRSEQTRRFRPVLHLTPHGTQIPTRLHPQEPERIESALSPSKTIPELPLPMSSPWCLSAPAAALRVSSASGALGLARVAAPVKSRRRWDAFVVCMAPDEEKITRRSPLDFPIVISLLPPFLICSFSYCYCWRNPGPFS
jgi:hypothetical protein